MSAVFTNVIGPVQLVLGVGNAVFEEPEIKIIATVIAKLLNGFAHAGLAITVVGDAKAGVVATKQSDVFSSTIQLRRIVSMLSWKSEANSDADNENLFKLSVSSNLQR